MGLCGNLALFYCGEGNGRMVGLYSGNICGQQNPFFLIQVFKVKVLTLGTLLKKN